MRKTFVTILATVAAAAAIAAAAGHALAGTDNPNTVTVSASTITACVNKKTHQMYDETRCPKGYSQIRWNIKGATSVAGRNGTNGASGTNGTNGAAASVSVGTVNTGAAGSSATVANVGSPSAAKLNFTIPQGAKGDTGATGSPGAEGAAPWSTPVDLDTKPAGLATIQACPYKASSGTTAGTPATAVVFEASTYEFTGASCKQVTVDNGFGAGTEVKAGNDINSPDVDPGDWTLIASGGVPEWGTPVNLNAPQAGQYTIDLQACPFSESADRPASTVEFDGSSYEFTGSTCKDVMSDPTDPANDQNTPDVDPSDWTEIAAAGANGTVDAWAVIDPGVCAAGGSCTSPVIAHGGVPGSGVSFDYHTVGQYELTVTGCPAADTPPAGNAFPVDVQVTPEGAYPGESSHDSSVIAVSSSVRFTGSLGVLGGLGVVNFYLYLGTPDQSVIGQTDSVDEPFAVSVTC